MRLAIICGGRASADIEHNTNPLKYISNSIEKVKETLEENSWICKENYIEKDIEFDTLDNFFINLKHIVKNEEINEFLFYYTGHGKYGNTKSKTDFQLRLESEQITIAQLVETIHNVFENQKSVKIALVIDSCYSGEAITKSTPYTDIEILTSTDDDTKSYEKLGLDEKNPNFGISVFSHYFCEAFNTLHEKNELCLESIGKHVESSQDEQEPYYDGVQGREKIVIGYNKETNINSMKLKKRQISTSTIEIKMDTQMKRREEIEEYIVSNELSTATKLIVELTSNSSKQLRREALLHQSNLNSINEELRKFGQCSDLDMRLKRLKNALFEFLDILGDR